jgi:hypothetical protein
LFGVEANPEVAAAARRAGIYDRIIEADAVAFLEGNPPFDIVVAAELIEHYEKTKGRRLGELVKEKGRLGILTSPLGFMPQGAIDGNPLQKHLAGWDPDDFGGIGFKAFGIIPEHCQGVYVAGI